MRIRACLLCLSLLLLANFSQLASAQTDQTQPSEVKRPNIIFILADDLGYGDLGCYGRQDIQTPHLDKMAKEGVRFTAHYANGPECTPTRTAFLTGRYQQWVGGLECAIGTGNVGRYDDAIRLAEQHDLGLPTSTPTIVKMLQQAGYATAITGKWHLGYESKFAPHRHGFEKSFYCVGGGMDYFYYLDSEAYYNLFEDGQPIHREGYFTDLMTDEALEYIDSQRDRPYFLYIPYTAPHAPFQGPEDDLGDPIHLDAPVWNQGSAPPETYIAMIERMDQCIGKIVEAVDARRGTETRETVILFASDNGGTKSARNAPLSGIKGSTNEGGIRVPGIAYWPGMISAGIESDQPCMTFDFTKSIANLAGVTSPESHPLEGIDILQHVIDGNDDFDRTLYWRKPRGDQIWKGIRDGQWKYILRVQGDREEESLFDLSHDVSEEHDLKTAYPEQAKRLRNLYENWEQTTRENRRGRPEGQGKQ